MRSAWERLLRSLRRLVRAWLLACGVALNVALLTAAWIAWDEGPGAVWRRLDDAATDALSHLRALDAALAERRGRHRVAAFDLASPPPAEPVANAAIAPLPAGRRILRVGPGQPYPTPGAAARAVRDGDVIEIEPGHYRGESVQWTASNLIIRGRGGLARIDVAGVRLVQDKGAWLVQGDDVRIERIAFSGARSRDRNGAGIRAEGGHLLVRGCVFIDNESGVLSNNVAGASIVILDSVFAYNGHADGQAHQIYIGTIARFELRGSYLHATYIGSAVKSRAEESLVIGNRIVDGADGHSNYTLDFSLGGRVMVAGNELEQGPFSGNRHLIAFAPEGSRGAADSLTVVHNTLVDDRGHGTFVWNRGATPALLTNNLFVGGRRVLRGEGLLAGNVFADAVWLARWGGLQSGANRRVRDAGVADRAALDYALVAGSPAIDAGGALTPATLARADPLLEYVHPAQAEARATIGAPDAGAHEFVGP